MKPVVTALVALTLPVLSLADVNGTTTLTANMTLNLDAGSTGTSGGDLLWNGSALNPQASATAGVLPSFTGASAYGSLTSQILAGFAGFLSNASISGSSLVVGAIVVVHTNGGNYAKLLVTSTSSGSLGIQYTTFGAAGGGGGGPSITDVQNAASNIPSGLPNGALAQGSLFVVKGANLGPATFIQATVFPLPKAIGGTSITVTVGSTTVDCIMFYSLARQVSAILPSTTPTGTGTLKLTFNGQSATTTIKVVQNNIGIYTVSTSGSGDAIAFLNSDSQLVTPTHAANADDVVILWGTGLGPVNLDETVAVGTNQADMPNVPLHVYIGGQEASILFRGRNGCCSSVDTVYVTVPHGVTGCAVSVLMQIGTIVSNATSMAIGQNGRTCTPVNPNVPVGFTGSYRVGGVYMSRTVQISAGVLGGPPTTSKVDAGGGTFEKVTYTNAPPTGSQLDINSYGSCSVSIYQGAAPPPTTGGTVTFLDAGPSIGVTGPNGLSKALQKTTISGTTFYGGQFDQTATTLVPGAYTFTGTGGADVGAFTANYTLPPIFTWTDQASITSVNRATGVTVHWTGGNPSGYVIISGFSSSGTISVSFSCTAHVSDGSFTVPPVVLLALPASGSSVGGSLDVETLDYVPFSPIPSGLDAAVAESFFLYGNSVTYQ